MVKVCGVAAAMLQGHSWVPIPSNGRKVNVGTIPVVPNPVSCQLPGGKVRRRHATHPAKVKPELVARAPNEVWSWDIERHEAPV